MCDVVQALARRKRASIDHAPSRWRKAVVDIPVTGISAEKNQLMVYIIFPGRAGGKEIELLAMGIPEWTNREYVTVQPGTVVLSFEHVSVRSRPTRRGILALYDMQPL